PMVRVRCGETPANAVADGWCELHVEDNGIGFEESQSDVIFAMFQRLHSRGEYEGTGVGLALCRKIVEHHGGTITARSKPGEGATFVVRLPVRHAADSALQTEATAP
ncbi:MAG TPA: PAS domain-containing sensor histidine kinase, partial [Candidatus Hydrogenedentes bacterium]|nr:PAS domain-containing sensor histidine kinase [Candidatus Hydrogenedentota bacterium]